MVSKIKWPLLVTFTRRLLLKQFLWFELRSNHRWVFAYGMKIFISIPKMMDDSKNTEWFSGWCVVRVRHFHPVKRNAPSARLPVCIAYQLEHHLPSLLLPLSLSGSLSRYQQAYKRIVAWKYSWFHQSLPNKMHIYQDIYIWNRNCSPALTNNILCTSIN